MAATSGIAPAQTRVFLSHAGADSVAARAFAEILRRNGVEVWFDQDSLEPGDYWMETLEQAIRQSSAMVVYVGRLGVQNWVDREVRLGLELNTRDKHKFKLIPVFGEGADIPSLPPFLSQQQGIPAKDPEAIRRLVEVLRGEGKPAVPTEYWATHSPFRSLQSFDQDDAWLFFGRDHDTSELVERLQSSRVLVVIGSSGSGKSSLVRAGLIQALRRGRFCVDGKAVEHWRIAVFRPGTDPFGELVDRLPGQLAPHLQPADRDALITRWRKTFPSGGDALRNGIGAVSTAEGRTLLFADQFEELFTLAPKGVRETYIDALLKATDTDGVHLVLGLRADFYANCLTHSALKPFLQNNYSVLLMKSEQLRDAFEKRLALAGVHAEDGLTDALLADVGTEPGNLALLEHALAQLWYHEIGKYSTAPLTNKRYEEIGRLKGAIGKHAKAVYAGLAPDQQPLARRIFLELVQLGEGAQDTGRRVTKDQLLALAKPDAAEPLLDLLASKRLIATSGEQAGARMAFVEVSHEALIREWADLRQWVDEDREDLRFGRRLATDAEDWERLKDTGALLRGARLLKAEEWSREHSEASATVGTFVRASRSEEDDAQAKKLGAERALREAAEAREKAERGGREKLRRTLALLSVVVVALVAAGGWAYHQTRIARTEADRARRTLAANNLREATIRLEAGSVSEALPFYAAALRLDPSNVAIRAAALDALLRTRWALSFEHAAAVYSAWFSADGTRVVTASDDKTARVWDAWTGQPVGGPLQHAASVYMAAFSADGTRVVTGSQDKTARVWDARTGQPVGAPLQHAAGVSSARFSADGTRVVTVSLDGTARVWDARTRQPVGAPLQHAVRFNNKAVFSADGTRVVTSSGGTAQVWDAGTGQPVGAPLEHSAEIRSAAFSADGTRVVTGSQDKTARVWDAGTGQPVRAPLRHKADVRSAVFSADGTRVVTASDDKTARVWDARTGEPVGALLRHKAAVYSAVFSADGTRVVTASDDKSAQVWDARTGEPVGAPLEHAAAVYSAVFSADGTRVVTVWEDNTARVWDARTGQPVGTPLQHAATVYSAVFSAGGTRVVTVSQDDAARVWDARTGQPVGAPLEHAAAVLSAVFSADGTRVVTASTDKTARVRDARTGQPVGAPLQHAAEVLSAVFSADGTRVVTASWDKTARVWDARTGQPVGAPLQHAAEVPSAVFSTDGTRVVTASWDKTARVWDARTGQPVGAPLQHAAEVLSAVFSADGTRVVTASWDKTARVWDARTGQPVGAPLQHAAEVRSAVFSTDGTRVVTASWDKTARVWNARTGQPEGVPLQHADVVSSAVFSVDGTRVVTASWDKTARVWDARTGQPVGAPLQHADQINSAAFSADGTRVVTASQDKTARVWDAPAGSSSDSELVAEAAEVLSGYATNDSGSPVPIEDAAARVMALRQKVASARPGEPSVTSILQWLFKDPWDRTISPLSAITVDDYIVKHLKECTDQARSQAESYFFGHPLFRRIKEFCPGAVGLDTDRAMLARKPDR